MVSRANVMSSVTHTQQNVCSAWGPCCWLPWGSAVGQAVKVWSVSTTGWTNRPQGLLVQFSLRKVTPLDPGGHWRRHSLRTTQWIPPSIIFIIRFSPFSLSSSLFLLKYKLRWSPWFHFSVTLVELKSSWHEKKIRTSYRLFSKHIFLFFLGYSASVCPHECPDSGMIVNSPPMLLLVHYQCHYLCAMWGWEPRHFFSYAFSPSLNFFENLKNVVFAHLLLYVKMQWYSYCYCLQTGHSCLYCSQCVAADWLPSVDLDWVCGRLGSAKRDFSSGLERSVDPHGRSLTLHWPGSENPETIQNIVSSIQKIWMLSNGNVVGGPDSHQHNDFHLLACFVVFFFI